MAHKVLDRTKETTSTTGTGTFSLAGAVSAFVAFSAGLSNGDTTWYCAVNGTEWEIGLGTYASSGNTLARTRILENSNGDTSPVGFTSAPIVFGTLPAPSAQTVPLARAYLTGNQTISAGTWTKVHLNTKSFDPSTAFDATTNYRFTPLVPGYYRASWALRANGSLYALGGLYKNGSAVSYSNYEAAVSGPDLRAVGTDVVYLNGTTDYLELWVYTQATEVTAGADTTYLAVHLVLAA